MEELCGCKAVSEHTLLFSFAQDENKIGVDVVGEVCLNLSDFHSRGIARLSLEPGMSGTGWECPPSNGSSSTRPSITKHNIY